MNAILPDLEHAPATRRRLRSKPIFPSSVQKLVEADLVLNNTTQPTSCATIKLQFRTLSVVCHYNQAMYLTSTSPTR
uniref:Uncharacterized protein n=1 Tax=Oryza meridionalis TaxID=40149 RepID=A0A0E0EHP3_9ORYZ